MSAQLFDPGPELAGFTDEPKQLPSGAFGKDGHLKLGFAPRDGRTLLTMLDRRAPLLAQQALYWDEGMPGMACVYIICNSGGILQGDRYAIEIELAAGAEAHVTTQAATKIHEMDANHAVQSQTIVLDQDSYLEYVPQATIPFRHSRFLARTSIVIAESATLLLAEMLMPGRKYYGKGELFEYDLYSSVVRAERPDHTALFTEKFIISPGTIDVRQTGVMSGYDVFGNVLLLTPTKHAERIFDKIEAAVDAQAGWAAAIARLPNDAGLVYKVLGRESQIVRDKIREVRSLARREVKDAPLPEEFLWG